MSETMVRKQIYITKRQDALLKRLAKQRGVSEAEVIRQALEREFVDYGGVMELIPIPENLVEAAAGMLKGGDSLTAAIVDEHRQERERE